MAILKVYNGSSFITAIGKTYNGATWEAKMKFYNGSDFINLYPSGGPEVSPFGFGMVNTNTDATAYAGVQFLSTGGERGRHNSTGAFSVNRGDWLDSGTGSQVWIERTINTGSLNDTDPGAGRLVLSTTRTYSLLRTSEGIQAVNITFDFYDASSGGNLLDTVTYSMSAEYFSGA